MNYFSNLRVGLALCAFFVIGTAACSSDPPAKESQGRTKEAVTGDGSGCIVGADDTDSVDDNIGVVLSDNSLLVPSGTESNDGFICKNGDWLMDGSCLIAADDTDSVPDGVGATLDDGTMVVPDGTVTLDQFLCSNSDWIDES